MSLSNIPIFPLRQHWLQEQLCLKTNNDRLLFITIITSLKRDSKSPSKAAVVTGASAGDTQPATGGGVDCVEPLTLCPLQTDHDSPSGGGACPPLRPRGPEGARLLDTMTVGESSIAL
jgi:hypothetical protein